MGVGPAMNCTEVPATGERQHGAGQALGR